MENKFLIRELGLKYGFMLGLSMALLFLFSMLSGYSGSFVIAILRNSLVISAIIYGHNRFKEGNEGSLRYRDAVKLGTLLVSVGYIVRSFTSFMYVRFVDGNFLFDLREKVILNFEKQNLGDYEMNDLIQAAEKVLSPEGLFIGGIISGTLVGLVYSLIASLFTRNETL